MSRTRQPTKSDLARRCAELEKQNTILLYGLQCAMHAKPTATERWRHDGWSYVARLYYPKAPHGGIVIVSASMEGQRPSSAARYLDDWAHELRPSSPLPEQEAAWRLRAARNAANDRQHRGADEFLPESDAFGVTSGYPQGGD